MDMHDQILTAMIFIFLVVGLKHFQEVWNTLFRLHQKVLQIEQYCLIYKQIISQAFQ